MKTRGLLVLLGVVWGGATWGMTTTALAQATNPYAANSGQTIEAQWPPYYKPPAITAWEAVKYENGWCLMNRNKIAKYQADPNRYLNVNVLPKVNVSGRVIGIQDGMIAFVDGDNVPQYIMIHSDPAVSAVRVKGTALPDGLRRGQYVKFMGRADAKGQVAEPIQEMEVISPPKPGLIPQVIANKQAVIIAQVVANQNGKLTLMVPAGRLRSLTATVGDQAKIEVKSTDYKLASADDNVRVTGRLYKAEVGQDNVNATKYDEIFALEVEIELAQPLTDPTAHQSSPPKQPAAAASQEHAAVHP